MSSKSSVFALKKLLKSKEEVKTPESSMNQLMESYQKLPAKIAKRLPGRPKKADEDKVQVISLKLPPKIISFLDDLILPHPKAKGRGGKIRYMMVHFVKMKKREIAQLKVLVSQLRSFDEHLSQMSARDRKDPRKMKSVHELINSLRALVDIYKIEMKDYKRMLKPQEFRLLELAMGFEMRPKIK